MQYLGGKTRIAAKLAAVVNATRGRREFWDPFCGGLSMAVALGGRGLVSDANAALVSLYQAVAAGWDPPEHVTEDEYQAARALPDTDPRKAFCGFGCSFGGKWFGGYARNGKGQNYASGARTSLLKQITTLLARDCRILCVDFLAIEPRPTSSVLYLDPPYANTTGYGAIGRFDHERFCSRVAAWSRYTDVFVSEYAMPWGRVVLELSHDLKVSGGNIKAARCERLYHYGPDRVLDAVMI